LLSAEVARGNGTFGPPFDHLTLRVDLDQPWLVDVGFGDSFRLPLPLESSEIQEQEMGAHRLLQREGFHVLEESQDKQWVPQYRFQLEPHVIADYQEMCRFHQTSPDSHFTRKRVCSIATPNGRVTLSEMNLITTENGERTERPLANEEEYRDALLTYFGVRLP
jgi:N-hydroxyarylamine O-acetyltransferase